MTLNFKKFVTIVGLMILSCLTQAADRYWVSSTSSNWNNTANWSTSSGGSSGASVPGSSDIAYFTGGGSKNGDCAFDITITLYGFYIQGYTGTISQGSYSLTVTGANVAQTTGTFTGGSANIDFDLSFTLSGGTFTSTSGIFYLGGDWTHTAGGTFNHNSGTLYIDGYNGKTMNVATSETFYNLTLYKNSSSADINISANDIIVVEGALNWTRGYFNTQYGGTLLDVRGNVTLGSGLVYATQAMKFTGSANQTFDLTGGTADYDGSVTIAKSGGTVTMNSNFTMNGGTQTLTLTSGTLNLNGYTVSNGYNSYIDGTFEIVGSGTISFLVVTLSGSVDLSTSGAPTINVTSNFYQSAGTFTVGTASLDIDNNFELSGGTFNPPSTLYIGGNWTHTAGGTFNHNNGTVVFDGTTGKTINVNTSETFYNLTMNKNVSGDYAYISANDILIVTGTLNWTKGYFNPAYGGTLLDVRGNVNISPGLAYATQAIKFSGSANQTFNLTGATADYDGSVTIDKSAGTVTMNSNFTMNAGTQTLTLTNGILDLNGYTVTNGYNSYCDGTFEVVGPGTLSFLVVTLSGSVILTTSGAPTIKVTSNFYQSAGTFTLSTASLDIDNNFQLSGGTFNAPSTMYVGGSWTHTGGGTFNHNNGTVVFDGSNATIDVASSETFYNLTLNKNSTSEYNYVAANDLLIIAGSLNWTKGYFNTAYGGSMLEVRGNVTVGAVTYATHPMNFKGSANQTFDLTGATANYDGVVTINKTSGTVTMNSDFVMNSGSQSLTLTSGTLDLNGYTVSNSINDITFNGTFTLTGPGTISTQTLNVNSPANVTISGGPNLSCASNYTQNAGTMSFGTSNLDIDGNFTLAGGTFTAPDTMYVGGSWTHTSGGTFVHNNGTVIFDGYSDKTYNVATSDTFYNLTLFKISTSAYVSISANDIIVVTGTLNWAKGYFNTQYGGTILDVRGDVIIAPSLSFATQSMTFTGSANQTFDLTGAAANYDGTVTINKSGGAVNLLSDFTMNQVNQSLTITAGTFDLNGYNLTTPGSGGTFSVASGGNLQLQGGETISSTPTLNTGSTVTYDGTSASYTVKNYSYKNLTIAGGSSSVFALPANLSSLTTVTISQGILSLTGYNLSATTLSNNGTFRLQGNETISFTTPDVNSGIFEYVGRNTVENLTIKDFGATDYYSLTINDVNTNKATFILGSALRVDGTLTLTSANISLGSYDLNMASAGTLSGGSSASFVYTGGTGAFKWLSCAESTARTFPVGHTNSTAGYTPLIITFNGGHTTDDFDVIAVDKVTNDGTRTGTAYTDTVVKVMWLIEETLDGGSDVDLTFQWNASDEGTSFNRANCFSAHYTNSAWEKLGSDGSAAGSNPYTFTYESHTASFSPYAMGGPGSPLPISLLYVSAERIQDDVRIEWATASEENNDFFTVERSLNGQEFETVKVVRGAGNSQSIMSYLAIDSDAPFATLYYRLRQTDFNGDQTVSKIVVVNPTQSKRLSKLYPMPASDKLNVQIDASFPGPLEIQIFNMSGMEVLTFKFELETGNNEFQIDTYELPTGIYILNYGIMGKVQQERIRIIH